jgi:DNA helicase IV
MKEQNYFGQMDIRTPSNTTMKEQNYVGKMGIRTPCYTTIKQQIILVIWVSEHHAIL